MKLSPFVFKYDVDENAICLYHSITLKKVFLSVPEYLDLLRDIGRDDKTDNVIKLKNLKFVVEDNYNHKEALAKVFDKLGTKEPTPSLSYFILTDSCNFRCSYCFIENALNKTGHNMTQKQADEAVGVIINNSKATSSYGINFYGGEPLLNFEVMKHIVQRLETADKNKFQFTVVTNGSMITDEISKYLELHKFGVGLSLDGWAPLDNLRVYPDGKGTFYDALKGLALLKKYGVKTSISCTVNKYNYQHLTEIVDFFSNLGVGISFNIILDKLGRSYSVDDPTALSKALFSAFSRASELGILEDRIGRRRAEPFFTEIPRLYDCPAYGQQIFFSPKGTLGPCQAFYTTELYQEKITPDFDAKKSDVLYPFIKMGGPFKSDYCTECPAIGICGGSCPYDVYTITGKLGFIDPYFCSIMKETLNNLIGYYYKQKVKSQ